MKFTIQIVQGLARGFALLAAYTKSLEIFTGLGHFVLVQFYMKSGRSKGIRGFYPWISKL
jgi:hypothetical protein